MIWTGWQITLPSPMPFTDERPDATTSDRGNTDQPLAVADPRRRQYQRLQRLEEASEEHGKMSARLES